MALVAVSLVAELVIHKRNPVQVKFKPRSQLLHLLIKAAAGLVSRSISWPEVQARKQGCQEGVEERKDQLILEVQVSVL